MRLRFANARTLTAITAAVLGLWALTGGVNVIRIAIAKSIAVAKSAASVPESAAAMDALHRRHDVVTQSLAVRPMAAQNWIALAALRNALAMPPAGIDSAFLMSSLTGPAEGDVMAQRVLLGLLLWETVAAETRARALSDLCGLIVYEPSRLRLVLATKSEAVRMAIRNGLTGNGCTARTVMAIGL